ncbi:hypothetical protein AMTRI_Chr04g184780 [Amborella trichopoda]
MPLCPCDRTSCNLLLHQPRFFRPFAPALFSPVNCSSLAPFLPPFPTVFTLFLCPFAPCIFTPFCPWVDYPTHPCNQTRGLLLFTLRTRALPLFILQCPTKDLSKEGPTLFKSDSSKNI